MENQMFCYQCQGKLPDEWMYSCWSLWENTPMSLPCRIYWSMLQKGISAVTTTLRQEG